MRSVKINGGLTRGRGVWEPTRQLWLGRIHTSKRISRSNKDLGTMKEWFDLHIAFDQHDPNRKNISSSLVTDSRINCDDAKLVGESIHSKLGDMVMEDLRIKRKDKVQTFESLLPTTKIENNNAHIKPLTLFTRLTALVNSEDDIAANFCYELTSKPTTLLKDGMMRKPPKSVL